MSYTLKDEQLLQRGCRVMFALGLVGVIYGNIAHDWMMWATGALSFYLMTKAAE